MLPVFLQGLSLGLAFLAPIGMQNLFVINSALSHTFGRALATSLVVVFWDISLGVTCFLGAGTLMDAFPWLKKIMLGLGGLLVIYIGIGLIRTEASLDGGKDVNQPFLKIIVAAFVVTWLNPQALIDGTMMLGGIQGNATGRRRPSLHPRLHVGKLHLVQRPCHSVEFARSQNQYACPYLAQSPLRRCDHLLRSKAAFRFSKNDFRIKRPPQNSSHRHNGPTVSKKRGPHMRAPPKGGCIEIVSLVVSLEWPLRQPRRHSCQTP